ncbi:transmembrane protein 69 [Astyanax mexicanus]|uniref:Transmembrane protein 69 n=2 Tax=Astyanax mexicanus TaxID=7994 RepID=A0A8B9RJI5_ASTMX|nr:transmembrane protein 69 [Astyanax mexicanus]KAG9277296.1 transmembrane protein 69 [Astyanax mexicanus]
MSLALFGKHLVSRSWCLRWSSLQCMSRTFYCSGHQTHSPIFLAANQYGQLPSRCATGSLLRVQSFHCSTMRLKKRQPEEPPPRELDLVRYDMRDLKKSPKPALYLGFSGLIPFVSAPLFMAMTELYLPEVAFAQVAYGASILSFLGGARWGFALPEGSPAKPDWLNLANSVVPSLLAWIALLFSQNITHSGIIVIMGLGISLHYDLSLLPTYPSWFKALRTILTVVAFLSLVGTLVIKELYPEKKYIAQK